MSEFEETTSEVIEVQIATRPVDVSDGPVAREKCDGSEDLTAKVDEVTSLVSTISIEPAIVEDHAFIREFVVPAAILTLTKDYVTIVLIRTAYSRIQMRLQYLPRYPQEIPLIELSSPTLPVPLLRQLEKKCSDIAKENLGRAQVRLIYEHLNQFIQGNMFVPCWKELKQVTNLCEGKGAWGVDEKEGVIQLRLQSGQYRQVVKLRVPVLYPEEGVKIEFTSSTFPLDMQHMFRSQAEVIVSRCVSGFTPDVALSSSNPIQLPATKSTDKAIKLTSGSLKSLKHDVNVLKQMSDLRDASSAHKKKVYVTQATAERREARKDLRRLAKAESEADQEMEKQIREAEQNEMKELLRSKISDVAQPSLLAVARFLIDDYATRLPREVCQACRNPALPEDPSSEALRNPQSENRPMRTFCGHWLHYRCLNEWLTTPPFIRQCSACDRRIWHPDWPEDHKQLEKAWQTREARKREVSDVSDFMGMGSEFSAF